VDILLNDDYIWSLTTFDWETDTYDIQSVATHEIGHLIGIGHSKKTAGPASEYPTMQTGSFWSSTGHDAAESLEQRSLATDDVNALNYLYGSILRVPEVFQTIGEALNFAQANTTVLVAAGTHIVSSNLTISNGVTLQINPNATINFASGTSLTINGLLTADSNDPNKRITFTGATQTPGSWNGIKINSGSIVNVSTLRRCDVQYATDGIAITYTGTKNNVTIDKCRISNNSGDGIDVLGNGYSGATVHPTISNNHIHDNTWDGIYLSNYAKPRITGNRIENNDPNGSGIYGNSSASAYVEFNYVKGSGYGIAFEYNNMNDQLKFNDQQNQSRQHFEMDVQK
jgi:parallel beta-helix repeat protein